MLPHHGVIGSNVDAINLVLSDEAFHPLDLGPQVFQHAARLLRNCLNFVPGQTACVWNLTLDDVFGHPWFLVSLLLDQSPQAAGSLSKFYSAMLEKSSGPINWNSLSVEFTLTV